ncbi:lysozyme [Methylobacterium sp. J-068]|uniref:lysozyme n=1 Tax=Methylobacterium sp. J-068 TaxID=2836649 RepID=UPI001FBA16D8|nr:lysozyme [Methylobacterium sp. J-068]MCJ2033289.1 lysozyme [Methylobacterium sp. J-068]
MDMSAIGRAVLTAREGRRLTAYRDSVGIWTIGIGHTSAAGPPLVTPGLRLTEAACDDLFRRDLARYVRGVAAVAPDDLPDHAFDALVSLCFNIGLSAFERSTVARCLKAGDRAGAAEAILLWNRPTALIPRREAEYDQFRTPYSEALPRARRGDAAAISDPRPARTPLPAPRRPAPRPRSLPQIMPSALPPRPVEPGTGARRPGAWARLWAGLRGRASRDT